MANTDRRNVNLLFEPIPAGAVPGTARGCKMWLIDQGQCGLWPANKLDGRRADEIPEGAAAAAGELRPQAELVIGALMPPEYRMALKQTTGSALDQLLDGVRAVGDDLVEQAVSEVPRAYIKQSHAEATVAFLKGRRDGLDRVITTYWQ
jgi:hypothetical protein